VRGRCPSQPFLHAFLPPPPALPLSFSPRLGPSGGSRLREAIYMCAKHIANIRLSAEAVYTLIQRHMQREG